MLILQRKKGESIQIGDDIIISVSEVSGDKVKLAIEAPLSIPVLRTELVEAAESNKEAADISAQILKDLEFIQKSKS